MAQAYIRALERRLAEGQPINNVASVASFFLSRIDVLVDQLLGQRIRPSRTNGHAPPPEQLFGKVAIANAKLAYQSFKRLFGSARWHVPYDALLQALEAKRQELLSERERTSQTARALEGTTTTGRGR